MPNRRGLDKALHGPKRFMSGKPGKFSGRGTRNITGGFYTKRSSVRKRGR